MILIEAAKIIDGGGYGLLKLLLDHMVAEDYDFHVILRPEVSIDLLPEEKVFRREVNLFNRGKVFDECVRAVKPDVLLCFGNFPPPSTYKGVKVYTYFHRVGLIEQFSYGSSTFVRRLKYSALSFYLKSLLKNTNHVVCQSQLVSDSFVQHFGYDKDKMKVYPFYDGKRIEESALEQKNSDKVRQRFIYVSNDAPHKNHTRLFDAWRMLCSAGIYPELVLTVPLGSGLEDTIKELQSAGARITNLGVVPYTEVLQQTGKSEFAIYPSLQESLGLGLVEAAMLKCKVLAADLPYTYEAVEPSISFDPFSAESIYDAVHATTQNSLVPETQLKMKDSLAELVSLMVN